MWKNFSSILNIFFPINFISQKSITSGKFWITKTPQNHQKHLTNEKRTPRTWNNITPTREPLPSHQILSATKYLINKPLFVTHPKKNEIYHFNRKELKKYRTKKKTRKISLMKANLTTKKINTLGKEMRPDIFRSCVILI